VINTYDDLLYLAGCSSICSKTSDGKILHARNLDYYYADLLGKDCLFVYEDLGIVSMGFPGYCGCLTATNRAGMTLSAHTSVCLHPARGMPTGLVYRTIMQYASTLEQAKDCLTHLPKTVGNNVMISSAHEGVAGIAEIHPQQVAFRDQEEISDVRWTTNHYRIPEMLPYQKKASIGSLTRHRSISQSLQSHHPETIDDLTSIMSCYDGNVE
jgi:predicted choloylglycine hydrolase